MEDSKYLFDGANVKADMLAVRFPDSALAKGNGLSEDEVNSLIKESRERHKMCHSKDECKSWIGKYYYLTCEMEEWREIANKKG